VAWDNFNGSVSARTIERNQQLGAAVTVPGSRPAIEPAGEAWLLVRGIGTELIAAHLRATELHGATKLARDDQRRGAPALARRGGETVIAYERSTLGEPAGGVVRVYVSSVASIVPKRRSARN
jgi:hypothetical protein